MSPIVLTVVLAAAVLHAAWNAMLKSGTNRAASHLEWMTWLCITDGLLAAAMLPFLRRPPEGAWPYIVASAAIHVVYQFLLTQAYKSGEFGQAYPVARGSSPMLVALGGWALAGEHLGVAQIAGIAAVCAGIFTLAFHGGAFPGGRLHAHTLPVALATGVSIASYSVVDAFGGRAAGDTPQDALSYMAWMSLIWGAAMAAIHVARRGARSLIALEPRLLANAGLAGVMAFAGYAIIIWAMTVTPMGLVSALRETSVVFAAVLARAVLGERITAVRFGACLLIAAGAVGLAWS